MKNIAALTIALSIYPALSGLSMATEPAQTAPIPALTADQVTIIDNLQKLLGDSVELNRDQIQNGILYLNREINDLTDEKKQVIVLMICQMTWLKHLFLSHNKITVLPPEIGNLVNLTKLVAFDNKLTELPSEIGNLKKLKSLGLPDNKLNSLPEEFYDMTSLENLFLSSNQLTEISPSISKLQKLATFLIAGNSLTSLPESILTIPTLNHLSIFGNPNITVPEELRTRENFMLLD